MNDDQINFNPCISLIIVTYQREEILIETIKSVLNQYQKADEVFIIDQSKDHQESVNNQLQNWHDRRLINWIKLSQACIPKAMNFGALQSTNNWLLYLDDDVILPPNFLSAHIDTICYLHKHNTLAQTAFIGGRVIQPWDDGFHQQDIDYDHWQVPEKSHFFMGGNVIINKTILNEVGNFDENFIEVAYRFENETADRFHFAGYKGFYQKMAFLWHMKENKGGTRAFGKHLTTIKSSHSVGEYYYLMVSPLVKKRYLKIMKRLTSSVMTKFHLKNPWYILITLIAELKGLIRAFHLSVFKKNK